eukprot:3602684-Amphidinium_carterae.1
MHLALQGREQEVTSSKKRSESPFSVMFGNNTVVCFITHLVLCVDLCEDIDNINAELVDLCGQLNLRGFLGHGERQWQALEYADTAKTSTMARATQVHS